MPTISEILAVLHRWGRVLGEIWYGMTAYGFVISLKQERASMERIFMLSLFGDLLGVPILPPYYSLRLLPYIIPFINRWRSSVLRERDLVDILTGGGGSVG
ncbi:MAG: hypothetical protein AB1847_03940 [bacterium]